MYDVGVEVVRIFFSCHRAKGVRFRTFDESLSLGLEHFSYAPGCV